MKKILCFFLGILLVTSGIKAQESCVLFEDPNLYPGATTQEIFLNFSNLNLSSDGKYAIQYDIYKDGEVMTDLELSDQFNLNLTTFTTRFTQSNYYGQYITHASDQFPNGSFNASSNMSSYTFNYFTGAYLKESSARLLLKLGWRSDRDYSGHSYMIVINLVTLEGGTAHQWKYRNNTIGGYNATLTGDVVSTDTITTIKEIDYVLNDTVCYNDAINYQYSGDNARNVTITADTIAKYAQPTGSAFASIIPMNVTFGNHCNNRIDSIGTVNFYVWPEKAIEINPTGHISSSCDGTAFGQISLHLTNAKAPVTLYAYKDGELYGNKTSENNGTFDFAYNGLAVGTYTFTCVDATGCTISTEDSYTISTATPKNWVISATHEDPICHDGAEGYIRVSANDQNYGAPVFTLTGDDYETTYSIVDTLAVAVDTFFRNLVAGTYSLSIHDRRGCTPGDPVEITITNPALLTSKDTIYCCANELVEGVEYKETDTIFTEAGEKEVHFTSVRGCDSVVTVTLIAFENPTIRFTNENTSVCQFEEIDLSLEEGDMRDNFTWNFDGGTSSNTSDITENVTVRWETAGTKTVSANYTQHYSGTTIGCRAVSDTTITITVNARPDASVSTKVNGTDSTMTITACAGDTITLTAINNINYTYSWDHSDHTVGNESSYTLIASANAAGEYKVYLTDTSTSNRCTITSEVVTITVNTPSAAVTPMEDQTICANAETTLTVITYAEGCNGTLSYLWNTDKTTETITIDNLTDTTTYSVIVTATIGACTATTYDTVVVNVNNPSVNVTPMEDQTICANAETTLTAMAAEGYKGTLSYLWNTEETTEEITINNLTDTTTYSVAITATIGNCTAVAKDTAVVNVNAPSVTLSQMEDQTICAGSEAKLFPIITNIKSDETTYLWNTGATTDTITVSPTIDKEYSVVVTAKVGDCTFIAYDTVNVAVLSPSLTLSDSITGPRTICKGATAVLTVSTTANNGTLSYKWSTNEETSTINPQPSETTKYFVTVTATITENDITCEATAKDSATITVNDPQISLNAISGPEHNTICLGDTATLTANPASSNGEVTYLWSNDSTTQTIRVTPTENGDYSVTATATIGNCSKQSSRSYTIYVNAPAIEMNEIEDIAICLGNSTILNASTEASSGTVTYAWTPNNILTAGATSSSMTATPTNYGNIDFEVVGTATLTNNEVTCTATDTVRFTLTTKDTVKYTVTGDLNQTLCWEEMGDTVKITAENAEVAISSEQPIGGVVGNDYAKVYRDATNAAGEYPYTINIRSNNGCNNTNKSVNGTIIIRDTVKYAITGDTTFGICVGSEITPIEFNFTDGNGNISANNIQGLPTGLQFSENTISGTPSATGEHSYTIPINNNYDGCHGKTVTGTITVYDTVKYVVTGDTTQTICLGQPITTISVATTNAIPGFSSEGEINGLTGEATNTSLELTGAPTVANTIHYTVNVNSNYGCAQKTITGTITVNDTNKLAFNDPALKTQTICLGQPITGIKLDTANCTLSFNPALDTKGLSYNTTTATIEGTPTVAETFSVTITANNANGCNDNKTLDFTITVNDTNKLVLNNPDLSSQTICLGQPITGIKLDTANCTLSFNPALDTKGLSYNASTATIEGTPTVAETFSVTITATNANGCNADKTLDFTIMVNDTNKLAFNDPTLKTQAICLGQSITGIQLDTANCTLSFNPALDTKGLSYNASTATIEGTPTEAETFSVTITAANANECNADKTLDFTITVNAIPEPTLAQNRICISASEINDTMTLTTDAGMSDYNWNVGEGTILSGANTNTIKAQWAEYNANGADVTVTYTDLNGCTGSTTTNMRLVSAPEFTISGSDANNRICSDVKDTLTITSNYIDFTWSPETHLTGEAKKKVFADAPAGVYTYNVIGTNTAPANNSGLPEIQCQLSHNITITVDSLPQVTITPTNPKCYDGSNGKAVASVIGSNPFTYNWSNENESSTNNNIGAGTYTLTVTDINGCVAIAETTLENPNEFVLSKSNHLNVDCNGNSTGSFTVSATGGTSFSDGRYQYRMEGVEDSILPTRTFRNLEAGIYTVTVLDLNACTATIKDTITEPVVLEASITSQTNVKCFGEANGTVTVTATGGTAPYTYKRKNVSGDFVTTNTFSNLSAGKDTIVVKDANSCESEVPFEITQHEQITLTKTDSTNINCFGDETGSISVTAAGGTQNYQYSIGNDYGTESTFDELAADTYTVTVKDDSNCTASVTFNLTQPNAALTAEVTNQTNVSCHGGDNGTVTVTAAEGTAPYTYKRKNVSGEFVTTNTFSNLSAGKDTIVVKDANGCETDVPFEITEPDELKITVTDTVDISCSGLSDGFASVTAEGGNNSSYLYSWDNAEYASLTEMDNLGEGTHTIVVKDANNCTDTAQIIIEMPNQMVVAHTQTNLSCFESNDGAIDITVTGGTPEEEDTYTFIWTDQVSTEDREDLAAGTYYLRVVDSRECKAYDTITITQPEKFSVKIAGDIEACANGTASYTTTLTAEQDGYTYTYEWYKDNAIITDSTSSHLYNQSNTPGTYKYKVVATQSTSNCTQADSIQLTVYALPEVTITGTDTICFGNETTLTASGASSYEWSNEATTQEITVKPISDSVFTVTATVEYQTVSCSKTVSDTVVVNALPNVAITSDPRDTICATETLTLTATGANSYEWSGDGIGDDYNNASVEFIDPTGSYGTADNSYPVVVSVEGTDLFGCKNTASKTIIVNQLPRAAFNVKVNDATTTSRDLVLCEGGKIEFTAEEQYYDGSYTKTWYKVGESTAIGTDNNLVIDNVTPANNGKYILVVTNDATDCEKTSDTVTVTVNELPKVTLTEIYGATTICADSAFNFNVEAETAETIQWVNGSTIMNETGNTYRTNVAGKYVVNVTDENGCTNTSDTLTVTVNELPTVSLTAENDLTTICADSAVHFSVGTDATTIQWVNGNTVLSETGITYRTTEAGKYVVNVTGANGCTNTSDSITVTVNDLPVVTVAHDTIIVCMQSEVELSATGADSYVWESISELEDNSLDGDFFKTGNTDVPGTAGMYAVEVTGTVTGTNCSAKDTIIVNVKDLQNTVNITLPKDTICLNETTGFKVYESYTSYIWTENPGQNSCLNTTEGDTVTFTGLTAGEHTISVTVEDENGCEASANTTVLVNELPNISLTSNAPKCQGDTVTFTTDANMTNYTWVYPTANATVADSTGAILKLIWNNDGLKNVSVNYTDANGCTAASAKQIEAMVNALPNVVINPGDLDTLCLGESADITVDAPAGTQFAWSTGSYLDAFSITPLRDSTIYVVGTDMNGCKNSDTIRFIVNDTVKFAITNIEQHICLGNAIENIVFDTANCSLNFSELDFTDANLTVVDDTIKGTPETAGTYGYALVATSTANPACFAKYANVTIYVHDTTKLEVTNYEQTMCLGQPIEAIEIDTANCSLAFENMPNDLVFDGEESTITGTLTQPGEYEFLIIATSNVTTCSSSSKQQEVTIVINDTNKLATESETTQAICLGNAMEDIVLDTANCELTFSPELSHGITYDAENHKITGIPDTAMVFNYTITATNIHGCNDPKTLGITITVNDTAKIELLSNNAEQKICLGESIEPIAFRITNGTASLNLRANAQLELGQEVFVISDETESELIFANDTITGTPENAGTYNYAVLVINDNQCGNKAFDITIVVDTLPAVTITSDYDNICPEGQQEATLTATANAVTYEWANNVTTDNVNVVKVMPTADSTFTVTVTDGNGCKNSNYITIGVHTLPVVTISGPGTICSGTEAEISVEIEDYIESIAWTHDAEAEDNVITINPTITTEYTAIITDANGCTIKVTDTVAVNSLPTIEVTKNITSDAICQNDTIEFTATDEYEEYVWKDGTAELTGDENVYVFATDVNTLSGEHAISVQVTDENGCVNSDTMKVTVNASPILTEEHNRVKCFGQANAYIDLTVEGNTNVSYAWTKGGDTIGTAEDLSGVDAGEYTVEVTGNTNNCSSTLTVTIEQPDALTVVIDSANSVQQLCNGIGKVVVIVNGGTPNYQYEWLGDNITSGTTDTLQIENLSIGDHSYAVNVTDDSNCTASLSEPWIVSSTRIEVYREINLMAGETYTHNDVTYTDADDGVVFTDVVSGVAEGGCDSTYVYTIHVYGLGFFFAEDPLDVTHSSFRQNYSYRPNRIGDTIYTSVDVDNMFYAYVTTTETTWNDKRVDMKYEVLFNDSPIESGDFDDIVSDLKVLSYHEHDNRFYGYQLHSATGESPATTFFYQTPSSSTAYYYDYFNFKAFNNMPQRIEFNFAEPGTYTIKLFVEQRNGGDNGEYWGIYNPYIMNRQFGPRWGGRNDNPTDKDTITARYMTVIVGSDPVAGNEPVVAGIGEYTDNAEPVVTTYPNPAYDMLYLNINGMEGETRINITDATGKVVASYNENLLNGETTLNYSVAKFAQGIYFLNILNNDMVITKKFIVTK